jgi:hypothetical protein
LFCSHCKLWVCVKTILLYLIAFKCKFQRGECLWKRWNEKVLFVDIILVDRSQRSYILFAERGPSFFIFYFTQSPRFLRCTKWSFRYKGDMQIKFWNKIICLNSLIENFMWGDNSLVSVTHFYHAHCELTAKLKLTMFKIWNYMAKFIMPFTHVGLFGPLSRSQIQV